MSEEMKAPYMLQQEKDKIRFAKEMESYKQQEKEKIRLTKMMDAAPQAELWWIIRSEFISNNFFNCIAWKNFTNSHEETFWPSFKTDIFFLLKHKLEMSTNPLFIKTSIKKVSAEYLAKNVWTIFELL